MAEEAHRRITRVQMSPFDSHMIAHAMQVKPFKNLDIMRQLDIRKMCGTGEIKTFGDFEKVMQSEVAQTSVDKNNKR